MKSVKKGIAYTMLIVLIGSLMSSCMPNMGRKSNQNKETSNAQIIDTLLNDIQNSAYKESKYVQEDVDSETVQWICATYAILTHTNMGDLGVIGGSDGDYGRYTEELADRVTEMLQRSWKITDRKTAVDTIRTLLQKGQRATYKEEAQAMLDSGDMNIDVVEKYGETSEAWRMEAIQKAYERFGENGLDGWDLTRANQVLGFCYYAGYISLEECLDVSLWISNHLQKAFRSWDEIAESYMYGHQFWAKDDATDINSESYRRYESYEELKEMEKDGEGPYAIPFDIELINTWRDDETVEANKARRATETEEKEEVRQAGRITEKDEEGYLTLYHLSKSEVNAKVKLPEGFVENEYSENTFIFAENEEWSASVFYSLYSVREEPDLEELVSAEIEFRQSYEEKFEIIDKGVLEKDGEHEFYMIIERINYGKELQYIGEKWKKDAGEWRKVHVVLTLPVGEEHAKEEMLELLFTGIKM